MVPILKKHFFFFLLFFLVTSVHSLECSNFDKNNVERKCESLYQDLEKFNNSTGKDIFVSNQILVFSNRNSFSLANDYNEEADPVWKVSLDAQGLTWLESFQVLVYYPRNVLMIGNETYVARNGSFRLETDYKLSPVFGSWEKVSSEKSRCLDSVKYTDFSSSFSGSVNDRSFSGKDLDYSVFSDSLELDLQGYVSAKRLFKDGEVVNGSCRFEVRSERVGRSLGFSRSAGVVDQRPNVSVKRLEDVYVLRVSGLRFRSLNLSVGRSSFTVGHRTPSLGVVNSSSLLFPRVEDRLYLLRAENVDVSKVVSNGDSISVYFEGVESGRCWYGVDFYYGLDSIRGCGVEIKSLEDGRGSVFDLDGLFFLGGFFSILVLCCVGFLVFLQYFFHRF